MSGKLSNEMSGNFLRFVNLSLGRTWLPNIAVNKKVLWMVGGGGDKKQNIEGKF